MLKAIFLKFFYEVLRVFSEPESRELPYNELYRYSHHQKIRFLINSFFMPKWSKKNFFVKYGLLEHISMHERAEKSKILHFIH